MLATFESILPIFLIIVAGNLLRRTPLIDPGAWRGLEQLGYWFLYPTLLFTSILNADFSGLQLGVMLAALLGTILLMIVAVLASWPLLDRLKLVRHAEYSSVFQTAVRWNGFMALAIAQKIFPPAGVAVVALAMAVIIIPLNIASVLVVTGFAGRRTDWRSLSFSLATNPMILPCVAAILFRALSIELYAPLNDTLRLVGSAAIGMGLLAIGAGLRPEDMVKPRPPIIIPVVVKLLVFPLVLIAIALMLGIDGQPLVWLTLCAAVPTALNGYLLARQLGGDAELYAAVTTLQTGLSFLTIPLALAVAAQLATG